MTSRRVGLAGAAVLTTTLAASFAQQAMASGFSLPELNATGLALSNAVVANTDEVGAIAYNPALMAFHSGTVVSGSIMTIMPNLEVTTANGNFESQGLNTIFAPGLQISHQFSPTLFGGVAVSAPFGLETDWQTGVFPKLVAAVGGILQPRHSRVEIVDVNPALAYRVTPNLSLSAGLDYYLLREVVFNAVAAEHSGDGDALGFSLAAAYQRGPWSAGFSYHSDVSVGVTGTGFFPLSGQSATSTANIPLPWRAQLGVRYQATPDLDVEFDITRTGWSRFGTLTINNTLSSPITSTNNWDDANAYRVGLGYKLSPQTRLRFGYSFDQTPQSDTYFSARIPDADRHLFSVGVGHELMPGLNLDAGYMYVKFQDNNFTGPAAFGTGPGGAADANGTDAYNGNYEAHVHLFGIGLSKTF